MTSDWRLRAQPVTTLQDPAAASRNAILQRNAEGIQNKYQTLPESLPGNWRDRATAVTQPQNDWRSRASRVEQGGFVGDLQSSYAKRDAQMQQSADAYVAGDQGFGETVTQQALASASKFSDTIGTVLSHIPGKDAAIQAVRDVPGVNVLEGAAKLAGQLPTGFGGDGTLSEAIPQEMDYISQGDTRLARNLRAGGQALNVLGTAKATADVGNTLLSAGKSTISGVKGKLPPKEKLMGQSELKQVAQESYDEAAYLGAEFAPEQVGLPLRKLAINSRPKPIAGKGLTEVDKSLIKELKDFEGYGSKNLTLDEVMRLDRDIGHRITKSYIDTQTGLPDGVGLELQKFQRKLRDLADNVPTAGNDALVNGKTFWRAQRMVGDLDAVAERAALSPNAATAMRNGYKQLYLDKDRIRGWPTEAKELLRKAAEPSISDDVLGLISNRLNAIAGVATGHGPLGKAANAATAHVIGAAGRGFRESLQASKGAKVQRAIVEDALSKQRPVNIPEPTPPGQRLLAAPGKLSRLPMSDQQVRVGQALLSKTGRGSNNPTTGASIRPAASQLRKLDETLSAGQKSGLTTISNKLKDGSLSKTKFVSTARERYGLTQAQARSLANEILKGNGK